MYQQHAPVRRSWVRRHRFAFVLLAAVVVLCVVGIARTVLSAASPSDHRDPAQLGRAMKAQEHGAAASCAKLPTGQYFCTVADTDGTSGNYTVAVAADGKSYSAS